MERESVSEIEKLRKEQDRLSDLLEAVPDTKHDEELLELRRENSTLRAWKDEALEIFRGCDWQAIGRELAVPLGSIVSPQILPGIRKLKAEIERLRRRLLTAAGDDLCRLSQEEIKAMSAGAVKIPPKEEFLASCERFHAQVAGEAGVMSNCLTLAQLIAENEKLRLECETWKQHTILAEKDNYALRQRLATCGAFFTVADPNKFEQLFDAAREACELKGD